MVSIRTILGVTFALGLSIGVGVMAFVIAVVGPTLRTPALSAVAGMAIALLVALVLLRWRPNIDTRPLWRFSILAFVLFVAGNALTSRGINAPDGGIPLVIGLLWVASAVLAYLLTLAGGYARLKAAVLG